MIYLIRFLTLENVVFSLSYHQYNLKFPTLNLDLEFEISILLISLTFSHIFDFIPPVLLHLKRSYG